MLVFRYFVAVGSVLLSMLLLANWYLPNGPVAAPGDAAALDRSMLRIHSGHKWPEKVVMDTATPNIVPQTRPDVGVAQAAPAAKPISALAELKPPERPLAKRKPQVRTRRVASFSSKYGPPVRFAVNPTQPQWSFGW